MAKVPLHTIVKVGQCLDLFTATHPEWSISEASAALNFPLSSTSILFASLASEGLLQRTRAGRYRLGWRLLRLSTTLLATTPFIVEAQSLMQQLADALAATLHLATLDAQHVVIVARAQGLNASTTPHTRIGDRLPGNACAVGKILLAHEQWEHLLPLFQQHPPQALTPNTITNLDILGKELVRVRSQGFAFDYEEFQAGISCVAMPIHDHNGTAVAALSVVGEAHRFSFYQEHYRIRLGKTAHEISAALGFLQSRHELHKPRSADGRHQFVIGAS